MAMLFCVYTAYLHPTVHPNLSYFGLAFPAFLVLDVCFVIFWACVKWKMVFLPLAGMLLCAKSIYTYSPVNFNKEVPEGAIKLMSYNVMSFGGKPMRQISYKDNPIVNYILASDADIVCVQEGSVVGVEELEELVKSTYPYTLCGGGDGCHFNMCLSKFPIIDSENIPIVSATNRCYAYRLLLDDDTLLVINSHLESYKLRDDDVNNYKDLIKHPKDTTNIGKYQSLTSKLATTNAIRGEQVDLVANYIDSIGGKYVVLCGDFNDSPISYTHHQFRKVLKDAYAESGNGPGISFHTNGMYFRIDHIFVNENIDTYRTKVDNSISESDHYPIISHLFLK